MEKAGAACELPAASGTGTKGKTGSIQVQNSLFTDGDKHDSIIKTPCFRFGEVGQDCPKNSPGRNGRSTGGGDGRDSGSPRASKDRLTLKHKKHYCALHKDTPGKLCQSWSSTAL